MKDNRIDNGREFDWGKASKDYAAYRDIYPESFYEKLHTLGIGRKGQKILDLGTGTGVLPRNMYKYGADFTGIDISPEQIIQAERLSREKRMDIKYKACPAEKTGFPDNEFDAVTAVQCWQYFDYPIIVPEIIRMLKPKGYLAVIFMNWLPLENKIAKASEELVLKYNPDWKGACYDRTEFTVPEWSRGGFSVSTFHVYDEMIPFTREAWCGRIRVCRGIGASLAEDKVMEFDREHMKLLAETAPKEFPILHEIAIRIFRGLK